MANRGTDPDSVVTNARARRLGVQTQAEQQADLRSQMRTGALAETPQSLGDNLNVAGDLTVQGNSNFVFDNAGDFVRIGPTYDPTDPLADVNAASFKFVRSGSVGQDSYLQITDVTGFLIAKIPVGDYHEFWQAGAKFKRIDGVVMAQIDATTGNATLSNGGDLLVYSDAGSTLVFGVDGATGNVGLVGSIGTANSSVLPVFGHLKHKSTAPSIAIGAALGTGGSAGVAIVGTDQAGTITLTAGTTTLTTGIAATITFASARPDTNYSVILGPADPDTGANLIKYYRGTLATGTWEVRFQTAPSSGVVYVLDYQIMEWTH